MILKQVYYDPVDQVLFRVREIKPDSTVICNLPTIWWGDTKIMKAVCVLPKIVQVRLVVAIKTMHCEKYKDFWRVKGPLEVLEVNLSTVRRLYEQVGH